MKSVPPEVEQLAGHPPRLQIGRLLDGGEAAPDRLEAQDSDHRVEQPPAQSAP